MTKLSNIDMIRLFNGHCHAITTLHYHASLTTILPALLGLAAMVLSQETLGSLDIVSFTLKLKLNGDELVTIVKRYTDTRAKTSGSTQTVQSIILVFTPAFGYRKFICPFRSDTAKPLITRG